MADVLVWNRHPGGRAGVLEVHLHGEAGADTGIIIKDQVATGQEPQGML